MHLSTPANTDDAVWPVYTDSVDNYVTKRPAMKLSN